MYKGLTMNKTACKKSSCETVISFYNNCFKVSRVGVRTLLSATVYCIIAQSYTEYRRSHVTFGVPALTLADQAYKR